MVLGHPRISGRHAIIEWEPSGWRILDLGSSNGTTVNKRKVTSWRAIKEGDVLRFGGVSAWRVARLGRPDLTSGAMAMIENRASDRQTPVSRDRFLIGTGPPCDLLVPEWCEDPGTAIRLVLFQESGDLWVEPTANVPGISRDDSPWSGGGVKLEQDLAVGLGETVLRIIPLRGDAAIEPTEMESRKTKEYDLDLHLAFDGPGEGIIRVVHADDEWSLRTGQRFILLYVLGCGGGGWVTDDELKRQLWGGRSRHQETARYALHKLIHDTRQLFVSRGIDGWFIEKDQGKTRLRLQRERIHVAETGDDP